MADTKHTVEIEIIANAKKLRKELKDTVSSTKKMEGIGKRMRSAGIKNHKDLAKLTKQMRSGDKAQAKKSLTQERKLEQQMKKTIRTMRMKMREHKNNQKAIQGELKELSKLEKAHRKLRSQRHNAGVFTGRERRAAAGGGGRVTGSGLAGAANFVGGAALSIASMIGGALIGVITSQLTDAYATRQQYGRAYGGLIGMGGTPAGLSRARGAGARFGFGGIETATQARLVGRETGQIGAVTAAQALARTTGMDVSEAGGFMGVLARGGRGFGGKGGEGGKRELVQVLAAGTASGLDKARMPEFFQTVGQFVQQQAAITAGDVDATGIAGILSAMGRSGMSGLQGRRGGAVLQQLDKAIKAPGGGSAGQALMLQAFGFGKPGGTTSFYDALRRQEQGVTGPQGAANLQALFSETRSQYGGGEAQILALRQMTGLTIDQLEAMREVVDSNLSAEQQQAQLKDLAAQSKSIEEQALDAMKQGFGDSVKRIASLENRLIGMGDAIKEPVERIQDVINRLIDMFFPTIVDALERIASFLEEIFRFIQDWAGDDVMNRGKEGAQSRLKTAQEAVPELIRQFQSGQITRDEYRTQLAAQMGQIQGARMRLFRDRGAGTALSESVGQMGANVGRMFGASVGETQNEKRERIAQESDQVIRQIVAARNLDRLAGGGVTGTRSREVIQEFLRQNQRLNRGAGRLTAEQQEQAFTPSGRFYNQFIRFLEANQEQYNDVLRLFRSMHNTVESSIRDNAEGPANTSRRSGTRPHIDATGGVEGRSG